MAQHADNRRLRIEPLERRDLLCGGAAGGIAGFQSAAQSALFARAHAATAFATAPSSTNSGSSEDESSETHLFATLTNSSGTVIGTAAYEAETNDSNTTQVLVIRVAGGAANASYEVTVGTTDLGALTTDANGNGRLILRSTSSSSASAATATNGKTVGTLPADFTLAAGAAIALASTDATVDALNGTFTASSGDIGLGGGFGCHGGDHEGDHGNVTRLVAQLTENGTSAGKAVFTTVTHVDGTTDQILRVSVKGIDAGTSLEVSIDGTSVGSITTDDNGNGQLILSSNPHNSNVGQLPAGLSVTSTSTITVGNSIIGTFSATNGASSSVISSFANRFAFRRR